MSKNDKAGDLLKELMEYAERIKPNPSEMLMAATYFMVYIIDSQSKSEKNADALADFTAFEIKKLLSDYRKKRLSSN